MKRHAQALEARDKVDVLRKTVTTSGRLHGADSVVFGIPQMNDLLFTGGVWFFCHLLSFRR
jgi:hypothetical protein